MKTIRYLFAVALLLIAPSLDFAAGEVAPTRVRAILVVASNEKGKPDPKLNAFEATLKRVLRFESYRAVADGTAIVASGGSGSVTLARDHKVLLANGSKGIRATWFEGARMITALTLPPGKPSVLGGPKWGDKGEVAVVILIPE